MWICSSYWYTVCEYVVVYAPEELGRHLAVRQWGSEVVRPGSPWIRESSDRFLVRTHLSLPVNKRNRLMKRASLHVKANLYWYVHCARRTLSVNFIIHVQYDTFILFSEFFKFISLKAMFCLWKNLYSE